MKFDWVFLLIVVIGTIAALWLLKVAGVKDTVGGIGGAGTGSLGRIFGKGARSRGGARNGASGDVYRTAVPPAPSIAPPTITPMSRGGAGSSNFIGPNEPIPGHKTQGFSGFVSS